MSSGSVGVVMDPGSLVPLWFSQPLDQVLLHLLLWLASQRWWRERCLSNKMSGCLRGGANFITFSYLVFRTSLFISSFIILWFATLWCVRPCMLRGRVGASGMVLSVCISYIYVRFGGWLAWCLLWGSAGHGGVNASRVLLLLRLVIYLWNNTKMVLFYPFPFFFCAFIRTVINQRFYHVNEHVTGRAS